MSSEEFLGAYEIVAKPNADIQSLARSLWNRVGVTFVGRKYDEGATSNNSLCVVARHYGLLGDFPDYEKIFAEMPEVGGVKCLLLGEQVSLLPKKV